MTCGAAAGLGAARATAARAFTGAATARVFGGTAGDFRAAAGTGRGEAARAGVERDCAEAGDDGRTGAGGEPFAPPAAARAGAVLPAGATLNNTPHFPQRAFFPSDESGAANVAPQPLHRVVIGIEQTPKSEMTWQRRPVIGEPKT